MPEVGSGASRQRRQFGVDVQQGEVVFGVVVDRGRVERGASLRGHRGVVLAGDDVGVGDDQPRAGDPARALDAEAAGGAEHANHRAAGADHVGVGGDRRVGRRHRRRRPDDRRRRIDPVERMQDRPRGRQHFVEAAQDHRALHIGPQLRRPRRVQGDGAEDPDQPRAPPRRPAPPHRPRRRGAEPRCPGSAASAAPGPGSPGSPPRAPRPTSAPSAAQSGA